AAEILSTMPSRSSCRASSTQSHCDSDRPSLSGRSQAILTSCSATEGGKDRLPSSACLIVQTIDAQSQKTADPPAGIAHGQTCDAGSVFQGPPIGEQQQNACSPCQANRYRRRTLPTLQVGSLGWGKLHHKGAFATTHGQNLHVAGRGHPCVVFCENMGS